MKTKTRFIIIDDDLTNNMLCSIVISQLGIGLEIETFNIPEKGFEYIVSKYSGVVSEVQTILLLDINMPTWSGWDFLENFEKLDEGIKKQIKIYMLSSSINKMDKARANENKNVVDYLEKPLNSKVVSEIITNTDLK